MKQKTTPDRLQGKAFLRLKPYEIKSKNCDSRPGVGSGLLHLFCLCLGRVVAGCKSSTFDRPSRCCTRRSSGYQFLECTGPKLRDTPFALVRMETYYHYLLCLLR